jgi:hypothetical protein
MERLSRAGILVLVLVLAAGALWLQSTRRPKAPGVSDSVSIDEAAWPAQQASIRDASRVQAFLMESEQSHRVPGEPRSPRPAILSYLMRSAPVDLSPRQSSALKALLLESRNYQNDRPPCTFSPNIAYRFVSVSDTVDVMVDHGCDTVVIGRDSTFQGECAIPMRTRLEELSYSLFRADSTIAAAYAEGIRQQLEGSKP